MNNQTNYESVGRPDLGLSPQSSYADKNFLESESEVLSTEEKLLFPISDSKPALKSVKKHSQAYESVSELLKKLGQSLRMDEQTVDLLKYRPPSG